MAKGRSKTNDGPNRCKYFEQQSAEAGTAHAQHVSPEPGHGVQRGNGQVGLVDGQPGEEHRRVRRADAQSEQQRDPRHHAHRTRLGADGMKP